MRARPLVVVPLERLPSLLALMSKAVRRAPFDSLIQEITHTNSAAHTADERKRPSRSLVPSLLRRGEQRAQLIARPELKAGRSGRLLERGNLQYVAP